MSSGPSSKAGAGIQESGEGISELVDDTNEPPEEAMPGRSGPAGAYEPIQHERRKGHQVITTAAYYRRERRGAGSYGQDEAQDWQETDAETDGGL